MEKELHQLNNSFEEAWAEKRQAKKRKMAEQARTRVVKQKAASLASMKPGANMFN